jgi:phosphatidylserine/phosphatidylglycerophosphate/cardiolipin synthase-like enzyme
MGLDWCQAPFCVSDDERRTTKDERRRTEDGRRKICDGVILSEAKNLTNNFSAIQSKIGNQESVIGRPSSVIVTEEMNQGSKVLLTIGIILAAVVIGVLAVNLALQPSAPSARFTGIGTSSWYAIHFTAPRNPPKESNPPDSLDAALARLIRSAQSSIDIATYQFDLSNVLHAILDANKRGVKVRVVTDIDVLNDPKENQLFQELKHAGIPIVGGNAKAIMHNKFVIVDKRAVWMGSWNFTLNDTYRYDNNGIVIQSAELARNYAVTFDKMFNDKQFGSARKRGGTTPHLTISGSFVENYFAPEDKVAEKIIARLTQAARTIDFMAFAFTDEQIGATVLERAQSGVVVRGVFETTHADSTLSQYGKLKRAGLDVRLDGNPFLMHHKVFIVDSKTVIFGSFNFSRSAEEENDENLLIIDDIPLAQAFATEFARVYEQAKR